MPRAAHCAVSLFGTIAHVVPLQCPAPTVALSLLALAALPTLLSERARAALSDVLTRLAIPFAVALLAVVLLGEATWLPVFFSIPELARFGLPLDTLGQTAQIGLWLLWAWHGISHVAHPDAARGPASLRHALVFLATSLWGAGAFLATHAPLSAQLTCTLLCLASAVGGFALCWHLTRTEVAPAELARTIALILAGLLAAATYREGIGILAVLRAEPALAALTGAYVAAVVGVAALVSRPERQLQEPVRPLDELPHLSELSPRQQEILQLSAEGVSTSDIARRLNLSMGTVSTHRSRALARLGFSSLDELQRHLSKRAGEKNVSPRFLSHRQVLIGAVWLTFPLWPHMLTSVYELFFAWEPQLFSGLPLVTGTSLVLAGATRLARTTSPAAGCPATITATSLVALFAVGMSLYGSLTSRAVTATVPALCIFAVTVLAAAFGRPSAAGPPESLPELLTRLFLTGSQLLARNPTSLLAVGTGTLCARLLFFERAWLAFDGASLVVLTAVALMAAHEVRTLCAQQTTTQPLSPDSPCQDFLRSRGLSDTEAHVAELIAQGYTGAQIQRMLYVSTGTVNGSRAAAYRKLGIHSRSELVALLDKSAGNRMSEKVHIVI